MALFQMSVHGGNAVAQQTKSHHIPVILQVAGALAILGPFLGLAPNGASASAVQICSRQICRCVAAFLQLELLRVY